MMARMATWSKAGSEYIYINMKMPSLRDHLLMQINGILYIKFDNELWYEWSFDKLIIEAKAEYGLNTIPGIISFDKIIPVRIDNWMILSKHKQEEVISKFGLKNAKMILFSENTKYLRVSLGTYILNPISLECDSLGLNIRQDDLDQEI